MDIDHAARVLAYQRQIARIRRRLIRYSHPDAAGDRLAASVRIAQRAAGRSDGHARPTDRPDR